MDEKLTLIEQHKEEEFALMLEDYISKFDQVEKLRIRNFVKNNYKLFKGFLKEGINDTTDRCTIENMRFINEDQGISCQIYNCEEIDKFSKVDLEFIFKFFDRHTISNCLIVKGSGELKGCNETDADQFMKMIDNLCRPSRFSFLQKTNIEE